MIKESTATQCLTLKQLKERKNFLLREVEKIDEIITYRESIHQEDAPLYPSIEVIRERRPFPAFIFPTEKVDKFELEEKKLTKEKSGAIKALMNMAKESIKTGIEEYEKKKVKKIPTKPKKEEEVEEFIPPPPPIVEEVELKKKVKKLPPSKTFKSYSQELNPILRDVWSKD